MDSMKKPKTLVMLSGGLVSATALALTVHNVEAKNVVALHFNGSKIKDQKQLQAEAIARHYGVRFESDHDVLASHYLLPAKKIVMLSAAAGWATTLQCEGLVVGCHADQTDAALVGKYTGIMSLVIKMSSHEKINTVAPFLTLTREKIKLIGDELKVPYDLIVRD